MANPRKRARMKGRVPVPSPEPQLQEHVPQEEVIQEQAVDDGIFLWEPEPVIQVEEPVEEEPETFTANDLVALKKADLVEIATVHADLTEKEAKKLTKSKLVDLILGSN